MSMDNKTITRFKEAEGGIKVKKRSCFLKFELFAAVGVLTGQK